MKMAACPTSIRFVCDLMERIGYVNFHRHRSRARDRLQQGVCYAQHAMFLFLICTHLLSTVMRSVRYLPEFFQNLLEDAIFVKNLQGALMLFRHSGELEALALYMERQFSRSDLQVVLKHKRRAYVIFGIYMFILVCALVTNILEKHMTISEQDLQIRKLVYPDSKHPERRLYGNILIPGIDETESWYFEVLCAWEGYINIVFTITLTTTVTLLPIIVTHVQGQYEMLAGYAERLGHEHRDRAGARIYYTDIERDLYVSGADLSCEAYERFYFCQLVRVHQKLSVFQSRVLRLFNTSMVFIISVNSFCLCLCIYQLTLSAESLSSMRLTKFLAELGVMVFEFFYLCHCSEKMDDCQALLRTALQRSAWVACARPVRHDLRFFLRRLQRPNHMQFNQGFIVLSHVYFLTIMRVSYNVVNCLRVGK